MGDDGFKYLLGGGVGVYQGFQFLIGQEYYYDASYMGGVF